MLTLPPKVIVVWKEISFHGGNAGYVAHGDSLLFMEAASRYPG